MDQKVGSALVDKSLAMWILILNVKIFQYQFILGVGGDIVYQVVQIWDTENILF